MKQVVQSYKNGEVNVFEVPLPYCRKGGILVRNVASLISIGTERLMIETGQKSLLGKAKARPDLVRRFIDKAKREGFVSVIQEAMNRLDEPIALGYSSAGVVVEVNGVNNVKINDKVACLGAGFAGHAEIVWIPENLYAPIPDGVDFEDASFVTLGSIALHGIRTTNATLGETVAVIGLGLIGLITVQILVSSGYKVIGIDVDPKKVGMAKRYGADLVLIPNDEMLINIENFTNGYGVDAAIITASASDNKPIETAANICRKNARIVLIGMADLNLTRKTFWEKELIFTVIKGPGPGCLESLYELNGCDYPINYVRWTEQRNMGNFIDLLAKKKMDTKSLITHRFDIDNALSAYKMILEKTEPCIGVVLKYKDEDLILNDKRNCTKIDIISCNETNKAVRGKNIGFIGGGLFTKNILLPALKKVKNTSLVGIATTRGMTSNHLARKFGFRYCTSNYRDILNDPDIENVFITTRHDTHSEMIIDALKSNKNVFVEKPLCIDEEQLKSIVETYNNYQNQKLMVGFDRRYSGMAKEIRQLFESRTTPLVMIYRINAGFLQFDHWAQNELEGGGRIIGEICHYIDFFQFICNEFPVSVSAECISGDTGKYLSEDNACITLKFSGGSIGSIIYSAVGTKAASRERIEIMGEEKFVSVDDYREMTIFYGSKKKRVKKAFQDIGYVEELDYFLNQLTPEIAHETFKQDVYTTMATMKTLESLNKKISVEVKYGDLLER